MRRLIVEFNKDESYEDSTPQLKNVKTLEQLQLLRQDQKEITMICRVEFEEGISNVEDYIKRIDENAFEVKVLEQEETGAYVVFIKIRLSKSPKPNFGFVRGGGSYFISREVREGKVKLIFLGSESQIRRILEEIQGWRRHYRIVSLTEGSFRSILHLMC